MRKQRCVGAVGMPGCRVDPLTLSVIKTALTAAALGITGYSRVLGRKVSQETSVPVFSGTEPIATTPPDVARAQIRQLIEARYAPPA